MGHGKKKDNMSLRQKGYDKLCEMHDAGRGKSKVKDKDTQSQRINSDTTFDDYCCRWGYFTDWAKSKGYHCKSLAEAGSHAQEYIDDLSHRPGKVAGSHMSASTIRTYFAPVAKVCGLDYRDYKLPMRAYNEYTRSRQEVKSSRQFSEEKNNELVNFVKCTGLRRSELESLRGKDLIDHRDGTYSIIVNQGKGGKYRESPIVGSRSEVQAVVERMRSADREPVWRHVPQAAPVHAYRADYAQRVYQANARPVDTLSRSDKYTTRGHGADNQSYDRRAVRAASVALGHSSYARGVAHYVTPTYDERGKMTDKSYADLCNAARCGNWHWRDNVVVESYLWGHK